MQIRTGTLVSYRNSPAFVTEIGAKITIRTRDGGDRKVREKDIVPIHPGPISGFGELEPPDGDIETAWQMLEGASTTLRELCELAYDGFTPATAWAVWEEANGGIYFETHEGRIAARTRDEVESRIAEIERKKRLSERKEHLLDRIRSGRIEDEDRSLIGDVEALARGLTDASRTIRDLGISEVPERAHGLLLRLSVWDATENPYPYRFGIPVSPPTYDIPAPAESGRRDLSHLAAYAIDDEGTTAADDAVSIDGRYLWVHVADPAESVIPSSVADIEAGSRGSTLHIPERTIHMLSEELISRYSLGIDALSPALSFKLLVDDNGEVDLEEIVPSTVAVTRLSYTAADQMLRKSRKGEASDVADDLARIAEVCKRSYLRRMMYAAPSIDLPEVRIELLESGISIRPIHNGPSRDVVLESMLMTGYSVARYAIEHGIPLPFTVQAEPDIDQAPSTLAGMWSARRRFKRSEHTTTPGAHAGLGLPCYVQATSPLRRYLDLLVHQQIRGSILGAPVRSASEVMAAIGVSDLRSGGVVQAERATNRHMTLAYLMEHRDWTGEAVVVSNGKHQTVIVPDLALEANLISRESLDIDETVYVCVEKIRLPTLECYLAPA